MISYMATFKMTDGTNVFLVYRSQTKTDSVEGWAKKEWSPFLLNVHSLFKLLWSPTPGN